MLPTSPMHWVAPLRVRFDQALMVVPVIISVLYACPFSFCGIVISFLRNGKRVTYSGASLAERAQQWLGCLSCLSGLVVLASLGCLLLVCADMYRNVGGRDSDRAESVCHADSRIVHNVAVPQAGLRRVPLQQLSYLHFPQCPVNDTWKRALLARGFVTRKRLRTPRLCGDTTCCSSHRQCSSCASGLECGHGCHERLVVER